MSSPSRPTHETLAAYSRVDAAPNDPNASKVGQALQVRSPGGILEGGFGNDGRPGL